MTHRCANEVESAELRPTQMTAGLREVEVKRRQWREADGAGRDSLLRNHVLPAVKGPKGRYYLTDHHHFALALQQEGVERLPVVLLGDLGRLEKAEFWEFMDHSGWCHSYNADGHRCALKDIPKTLGDLADDPYRSLAAELLRAGGFAKSTKPFFEFIWANFLRRRIKPDALKETFGTALVDALTLARGTDAKYMPGWCGVDPIKA